MSGFLATLVFKLIIKGFVHLVLQLTSKEFSSTPRDLLNLDGFVEENLQAVVGLIFN